MATSPNYGWLEPDNTDLVKNGALAIRTLGNAIDTTMATMTPKSIVDAKGDLIAGTAADTPARLAVGNNGETLVADSFTSTGLRYQSGYNGNAVINGAFDIWQRGTSFVPASYNYGADRFTMYRGVTGSTVSRQASGLTGFNYAARVQRDSGNTSTSEIQIMTTLETADCLRFAGQTMTVSFYARAGANFSANSSNIGVRLMTGTGTDQPLQSFTGFALAINSTATLTTSWTRYSYTVTLASTVTEFGFNLLFQPTGTAGAADYFDVTGVQIELGSVATNFKRASGGTIQGELAACQRYLPAISGDANTILGFAFSTTGSQISIKFPVTARAKITGIVVNPTLASNYVLTNQGFGSGTPTAIAFNNGGTDYSTVNVTTTAGTPTLIAGQPVQLSTLTSNGYILFTGAEL